MFPSFIGILDIQSWWEVPSIAHFCSLFRAAFNLLDFDIEELEEALLTDGTEETASSLLTELIVRLLCGCLGNNDISAFNYQMFLRRLFRQKCQETGRYNPFNTDIDFQFLPLRTKVEILYALCDFRLDADDVFDLFKNLEAESLRVEPLGWDRHSSAYWYFYGTRLYREDYKVKPKGKKRKKEEKKKGDEFEDDTERVWQVVCFTESDWITLTEKFKGSTSKLEKDLYLSLSENFLPEIPRLFQEKERLQRKRLLESAPRRTSSRVQIKQKQKEEEESKLMQDTREKKIEQEIQQHKKKTDNLERESRLRRREKLRTQSGQSASSDSSSSASEDSGGMWPKRKKRKLKTRESSLTSPSSTAAVPPKSTGRQTNNSLACATGQIVIPDIREPVNPTRKKVKSSQIYELLDQDLVVDMYKVLEQLKANDDAWPFMDPVEEDYAPNYYTVIRRPMDLKRMEDRLDQGYYTDFSMFKNDFKLIVNNCRLYNGQESEYTKMVNNLEIAFNKLTLRYFEGGSSSDDEIAIEYPIQNPYPRKQSTTKRSHKNSIKSEFENDQKEDDSSTKGTEKRKTNDESDDETDNDDDMKRCKKLKTALHSEDKSLDRKERGKNKSNHMKKKKKLKRLQEARKSRKDKHKKIKEKRRHSKHGPGQKKEKRSRRGSSENYRSGSNSRSSLIDEERPVAIKRHVSPEIDFYKDKFDKIKERRRGCTKKTDDSTSDKNREKKSNLALPEKDKHLNLKETIEKLKAKSEIIKPHPIYNDFYEPEDIPKKEKKKFVDFDSPYNAVEVKKKCGDEYEFVDEDEVAKENLAKKQVNTKNESAREALEQAMKDINKWLDDTPKLSEFGSNSNSPLQIPITDEYNISPVVKLDDETSNSQTEKDKTGASKKEGTRKRQTNKEPVKTVAKKKEVQRTIDRLQPGKSKGNLIGNIQIAAKQEENVIVPVVKAKEMKSSLLMKAEEGSPKLSLGTVLPTVGFGLGKQHNFTAEQNAANSAKVKVADMGTMTGESEEAAAVSTVPVTTVEEPEVPKEKDVEPVKSVDVMKQCQEKATPNLSAWFKAFGAPKSVAPSTPLSKKKAEEYEQDDVKIGDDKITSPLDNVKNEQNDDLIGADGSESPVGNLGSGIRARRTSTGSSISERSSFSQDLDSPRHQPSHPSPLLRSPASPRTDDIQKTYPLMNVTVRVGFYQDTTSVKSSPEKSCSPREAPQSPYANYSQHVYASSANGNNSNNPTHSYSEGPNNSPIPAYAQSPYYENVNANTTKSSNQEDFNVYASDNAYQQPSSPFTGPFSPGKSPYSQHSQHSPYSHVQSPQTCTPPTPTATNVIQTMDRRPLNEKSSAFPVKKRSYDLSKDTTEEEPCLQISQSPISNHPDGPSMTASSEVFSNNPEISNNPGVITSTLGKTSKPPHIGYPYETMSARDVNKQMKEDLQSKSLHSQYSDYASDYSIKKTQVNDYSLANLSKVSSEISSPSSIYQEGSQHPQQALYGDIKNISKSYTHDYSLKDKQQVDMVNMGYTPSEAHSHLAKLSNPDDLRNMSSYYNPPGALSYTGRMEQNKVTAANDYIESKRYAYEKSNSVLQYMKPPDVNSSEALQLNSTLLRSDGSKQSDDVDLMRSATNQMYKDWMKKNQDAHNLSIYKDNQSKPDKMSISQMATSAVPSIGGRASDAPTYDMPTNAANASPDENHHKNQTELIVQPGVHYIRAVIKISSSIKPESQPPTPEYNLRRNVNLNLPMPSTKSETVNNYDRSTPLSSANAYKPPHPIDQSLLNIPNLPQIMERYAKDERMLSPYPPVSSAYQDKNLPLMFPPKNSVHSSISSPPIYQPPSVPKLYGRTPENSYSQSPQPSGHSWPSEPLSLESERKTKSSKKKKSLPVVSTPSSTSTQNYHNYSSSKSSLPASDPAMALKPPSVLPGSAFNFGAPGGLASSLYGDSSYFLDPSTNQYMAANYIAAHQRSTPEIDKGGKPAHSSTPFQFLTPQVRPGYPLVGMESQSIYQQYIQRQQEEFLRPLHSQIMGMFPPGYNPSLGGRQPFDTIPRPWL